jgi:hypothetical protein
MYVEADWDCQDLLHNASQRLDVIPAAQRIFNADGAQFAKRSCFRQLTGLECCVGAEVDDCMMICDDDILFSARDEPFIAPEATASESADKGKGEGERLPHSVGGYKVGELLGRGGFGEVRQGEHQLTNEKVALKFLRKDEIHSLGAAERTNTEIQCLATLKHHNIIKLIQVWVRLKRMALISLDANCFLLCTGVAFGNHQPRGTGLRAYGWRRPTEVSASPRRRQSHQRLI